MTNVTPRNITVHNDGTNAGDALSCMDGGSPNANNNGEANAYGIPARTGWVDAARSSIFNEGGNKRKKFVFDSTVQNVDTQAQ